MLCVCVCVYLCVGETTGAHRAPPHHPYIGHYKPCSEELVPPPREFAHPNLEYLCDVQVSWFTWIHKTVKMATTGLLCVCICVSSIFMYVKLEIFRGNKLPDCPDIK